MGVSKIEVFTDKQNRIAELARALAHPARIAILQYLTERCSCQCGDIVDELPLAQATVSQHLKELRKVGLIKGDAIPPRVCYCINEEVWEETRQLLGVFLQPTPYSNCC